MKEIYCQHKWSPPLHWCNIGCGFLDLVLSKERNRKRLRNKWFRRCEYCGTVIKLEYPEDTFVEPKVVIGHSS